MKLEIENVQHHRNGVCGAPFHVMVFRDPDEGHMVGIVFDAADHVAVFNLDKLALGNINFGENSWRGDRYEPHLRKAINPSSAATVPEFDIHDWLAERKMIAHVWAIDDVQSIRPDLNEEQAWKVLQMVDRHKDAEQGITWDTLETAADNRFGSAPETHNTEEA